MSANDGVRGREQVFVICREATWGILSYMQHRHFCGVLARGPDYHKVRAMRCNSSCVSGLCRPVSDASDQRHAFGITLALYPRDIFQGCGAALDARDSSSGVRRRDPAGHCAPPDWTALLGLVGFAIGITLLSRLVFYAGLRRYESGSAINVNV
jgi:hypothetical protein